MSETFMVHFANGTNYIYKYTARIDNNLDKIHRMLRTLDGTQTKKEVLKLIKEAT